jgi:protein involved in sex pheromone biosynthesis
LSHNESILIDQYSGRIPGGNVQSVDSSNAIDSAVVLYSDGSKTVYLGYFIKDTTKGITVNNNRNIFNRNSWEVQKYTKKQTEYTTSKYTFTEQDYLDAQK